MTDNIRPWTTDYTMDQFYSCETCLFCLTPVERSSKVNWELKTDNYQDIIACNRKFLKDKINAQHSDWVCPPEGPLPTLCVKCFKCAENIHKVIGQMKELKKILEDLIEVSSLEINERISRLAPNGCLLADEIKVEDIKEEINVVAEESGSNASENFEIISASHCANGANFVGDEQNVLVTRMDLDVACAYLEEKDSLTSNEFHNIDQKIAVSATSPLQFLSDGELDETDVDPLELGRPSDVKKKCGKAQHEGVKYENSCPICKKKFTSINWFREHIKRHRGKKFVCDTCGSQFTTKYRLKEHCRLLHEMGDSHNYECDICGKKLKYERNLQQHIKELHKFEKDYACEKCGRGFKRRSQLRKHILVVHEKAKKYKCSICEESFSQMQHCQTHELTHSDEAEGFDTKYCKICGDKAFLSYSSFKTHQIYCHTAYTEEMSHCDICNNKFLNGLELYKHSSYQDPRKLDHTATCGHCKEILDSRCDLLIHVANSHPGKKIPYKCKVCGLVLSAPRFLTEHFNLECGKSSRTEKVPEIC